MSEAGPGREGGSDEGEAELVAAIAGSSAATQRRAVARAITLLESTRADHRERAERLLVALRPPPGPALRLGISGVPGVGKSTFIEALGLHLIGLGHRVAVLAVDPSSSVSGGSILGDKTRMERLSVHASAFVRPSPSSGTLGGVAAATREAMLVVEAAGYGVVIVETVGVGQSEAAVAGMTDMFILLQLPNAGDDLQAIKKGVMELADLIVVNKADLDANAAARAAGQIEMALHLVGGRPAGAWKPQVATMSALQAEQIASLWEFVERFRSAQEASGALAARRQAQAHAWLWERIDASLRASFRARPAVRAALDAALPQIDAGTLPVSVAARRLLAAFDSGGAPMASMSTPPAASRVNVEPMSGPSPAAP